jgi:hypothetical protein
MMLKEVRERAARLGLTAWVTYAIGVTEDGNQKTLELKCVGFSSADFVLGEGDTWDAAFDEAARIIFGA